MSKDVLKALDNPLTHAKPETRKLSDFVIERDKFAFRDDEEYEKKMISELAEQIASVGLITPLLAQNRGDGKCTLLDGHRRFQALSLNCEIGIRGFTADMEVAVNVFPPEMSLLDLTVRAATANIQRRDISSSGRIRIAKRLHLLGMPIAEIALRIGSSETTVGRDLALGADEEMMVHVQAHHITATNAAGLIKVAMDHNRIDQFKAAFKSWLQDEQERIARVEAFRKQNGLAPLPVAQTWPQKKLSNDQVVAWKSALERDQPLVEVTKKTYTAIVRKEDGFNVIEIGSLSVPAEKLSASQLKELCLKLSGLAETLAALAIQKHEAEKALKQAQKSEQGSSPGTTLERLKTMTLDDLLEEDDPLLVPYNTPTVPEQSPWGDEEGAANEGEQK